MSLERLTSKLEGHGELLRSMVLHGLLAPNGRICQKISKWTTVGLPIASFILTLILDPSVTNQPNIEMKRREQGRNGRYATSWSMVGVRRLGIGYFPFCNSKLI
jgi:hypothetical protein